jgi:hypothetical protein
MARRATEPIGVHVIADGTSRHAGRGGQFGTGPVASSLQKRQQAENRVEVSTILRPWTDDLGMVPSHFGPSFVARAQELLT